MSYEKVNPILESLNKLNEAGIRDIKNGSNDEDLKTNKEEEKKLSAIYKQLEGYWKGKDKNIVASSKVNILGKSYKPFFDYETAEDVYDNIAGKIEKIFKDCEVEFDYNGGHISLGKLGNLLRGSLKREGLDGFLKCYHHGNKVRKMRNIGVLNNEYRLFSLEGYVGFDRTTYPDVDFKKVFDNSLKKHFNSVFKGCDKKCTLLILPGAGLGKGKPDECRVFVTVSVEYYEISKYDRYGR